MIACVHAHVIEYMQEKPTKKLILLTVEKNFLLR